MHFIGQKPIIEGFRDKIKQNMLSHAYALTGPVGIGKRTLSHYLAKMLLCTGPEDMAPCGQCRACKSFEAGVNPGLTVIRSETKKILIKQIRGLIEDIGIRPASGRKVYLIEEAERMTPDAQNCLLKTLEEPPSYAVILLTTAYYESLLITVRSRIVQMKLKPASLEDMNRIAQLKGLDTKGKEHILTWSHGITGKALQLLGDTEFEKNREKVMQYVFSPEGFAHLEFNQYLSKEKEAFEECMDILESVYRDILLVSCHASQALDEGYGLINSDKKDKILAYAQRYDPLVITEKISRIHEIRSNLKRNMNYQLAVDLITLDV